MPNQTDRTAYPFVTPAEDDYVLGVDVSDTTDSANGSTRAFKVSNLALPYSNGYRDFYDYDYVDAAQMVFVRAGDTASQTAATVTTGIQALMDAAMDWVSAENGRVCTIHCNGSFAINDEIFSETFAENLWDLANNGEKFIFDGDARFYATGWTAATAVRTSGIYAANSISDVVPTVMFRWEQQSKASFSPEFRRPWYFEGEADITTDPIGIMARNVNISYWWCEVNKCAQGGWHICDINNSEIMGDSARSGCQITGAGGTTGILSGDEYVEVTPGTGDTTIVLKDSDGSAYTGSFAFTSDHVGRQVVVDDAGSSNFAFTATISSFTNATTVVLDAEADSSETAVRLSFCELQITLATAGTAATVPTDLDFDLTGRYVGIVGVGSVLHAEVGTPFVRVTAHNTSTGAVTLDRATLRAAASGTACITGPNFYIGKDEDQHLLGTATSGHNNDTRVRVRAESGSEGYVAVPMFIQNGLALAMDGCKQHAVGTGTANYGAAFTSLMIDVCKHLQLTHNQNEFGCYSAAYGKVTVTGERNYVSFVNSLFGDLDIGAQCALVYTDPEASGRENCFVEFSAGCIINSSNFPDTNQAITRNGTNGLAEHVGGVMQRRNGSKIDLVNLMSSMEITDATTPYLIMEDRNAGNLVRVSQNSGALTVARDMGDDGVFEQNMFGWDANGFWIGGDSGTNNISISDLVGAFGQRSDVASAYIPTPVERISVIQHGKVIRYRRLVGGDCLTDANGATWSTDGDISVMHWGADPTGANAATNDTAFQDAINAAEAAVAEGLPGTERGILIDIPSGLYALSTQLTLTNDRVGFRSSEGIGAAAIVSTIADFIFKIGDDTHATTNWGFSLDGIAFVADDTVKNSTATGVLEMHSTQWWRVTNCTFDGFAKCIYGATAQGGWVSGCTFAQSERTSASSAEYAVRFVGRDTDGASSNTNKIVSNEFRGSNQTSDAVWTRILHIHCADTMHFTGNHLYKYTTGINIAPDGTADQNRIASVFIADNFFDQSAGNDILINGVQDGGTSNYLRDIHITGNDFTGSIVEDGGTSYANECVKVSLTPFTGASPDGPKNLVIADNTFRNAGIRAITIQGDDSTKEAFDSVTIQGNHSDDCGQDGATGFAFATVEADNVHVSGNIIGADANAPTQCLKVTPTAGGSAFIGDNNFSASNYSGDCPWELGHTSATSYTVRGNTIPDQSFDIEMTVKGTTSGTGNTTLYTWPVAEGEGFGFRCWVQAGNIANDRSGYYEVVAHASNSGGTVTLDTASTQDVASENAGMPAAADLAFAISGTNIILQATGSGAGNTDYWAGKLWITGGAIA